MVKEYNLSELFKENEFDAQKGYNRCGTKEAYFALLNRFTLDSEKILKNYSPEQYTNSNIDINTLTRNIERLQGMLANIGAVNLAWRIQTLNYLVEKKHYMEYVRRLEEIWLNISNLRERIISAEKKPFSTNSALEHPKTPINANSKDLSGGAKRKAKPRRGDFKKLLMLIDNFEFESAVEAANSIMLCSYNQEIDETLTALCKALDEFNFAKSLEEAQKLFALAILTEETDKPVKKTILAIDDIYDVLRTVKMMLKDKYNVFGMTDYDSAIKFLRSNSADLILLDIEMPGLDGFAMLQLFRKLPEYADTPVVFLTSNVSDEHIRMAVSLGASDFIKKPVDLAVLVSKLENALLRKEVVLG